MQQGVCVSEKTLANLSRLPSFLRNIQRHVNHDGRSDDVLSGDAAPEATVVGISAIVSHDEIAIRGNLVRCAQLVGLAGATGVFFNEFLAVDPHGAIVNVDGVTGQADDQDRKSTRLNSSHGYISYAVFCLKQ